MNIKFIETFLCVARLGSFSAAAEKLCTTPASISSRVAALEESLGVKLFYREGRGVILTPTGKSAIPKAEIILQSVADFQSVVSRPGKWRGTIRIGAVDTVVHAFLPILYERVQEQFPGISIDLTVDTSINTIKEISERRIDLALVLGNLTSEGVINVDLGGYACLWVASRHLKIPKHRLQLKDLTHYPLFVFSKGSLPHYRVVQQFREAEIALPNISHSNSLASIVRLVHDGLGVALLPRIIAQPFIDDGSLSVVNIDTAIYDLRFYAIYAEQPDNPLPGIIAQIAADISLKIADI